MLLATTVSPANGFSAFEELMKRLRKSHVNCTTCRLLTEWLFQKRKFASSLHGRLQEYTIFPDVWAYAQTVVTWRSFFPSHRTPRYEATLHHAFLPGHPEATPLKLQKLRLRCTALCTSATSCVYSETSHTLQESSTCFRKCTCTSFLHSKDMVKVCIGQTIDRIANITHQ